jgi:hypothetical protein
MFYGAYQRELNSFSKERAWKNLYDMQVNQQFGVSTYPGMSLFFGPLIRQNPENFELISKAKLNLTSVVDLQKYGFIIDIQLASSWVPVNYFAKYEEYMTTGSGGALFFFEVPHNIINTHIAPFIDQKLGGGNMKTRYNSDWNGRIREATFKNEYNLRSVPSFSLNALSLYKNATFTVNLGYTAVEQYGSGDSLFQGSGSDLGIIWNAGKLSKAPKSRLIIYGSSSPFLSPFPGISMDSNFNTDTAVLVAENIKALMKN